MDRQGWTSSVIAALALLCALLLVAGTALAAPPVLLAPAAFQAPQPCSLDPFSDPSVDQREQIFARPCGRDNLQMRVDTPRTKSVDTGPSGVEVEVDHVMTMHTHESLSASARLGWSAATGEQSPPSGSALIAAGGVLKLDDNWALDLSAGHDIGPNQRTRATAAALYRPAGRNLMFVQFAAEQAGIAPAVGLRWRLTDNASLDVMARRPADGQPVEPRLAIQVFGFGR